MQITVVRSGSSCPLGEVLEHSEKVGPGGGGVAYIYINKWSPSPETYLLSLFNGIYGAFYPKPSVPCIDSPPRYGILIPVVVTSAPWAENPKKRSCDQKSPEDFGYTRV